MISSGVNAEDCNVNAEKNETNDKIAPKMENVRTNKKKRMVREDM